MKKNFFLTFMLLLLSITTGLAGFAPESGKKYALKEVNSGLYLDIKTGVYDGNNKFSNCLSLSTDPCVIYFTAGTDDDTKWTMRNVDGNYVMQASDHWIVNIGTTQHEWTIVEPETDVFTIARADGKFIGVDSPTNGACLYCDRSTGLQFQLMEYTNSYELGDIKSSDDLMAVTTATHIAVKNLTNTNNYYFAGKSSAQNFEDAILVLEPVTEGSEGTYYLRTTDATNGYIQQADANTNVSLGTKDAAQVFYTVEPTSSGSSSTYFNDVNGLQNADTDNLVRFVKSDATAWLNCQSSSNNTKFTGGVAYGTWTVHNVYAVNVTETLTRVVSPEDTDPYVLLQTVAGTYMSLTSVSTTAISFQAAATKFVLEPSSDNTGYYIKVKGTDPAAYIAKSSNAWDVTTSTTAYTWLISEPDNDGYVTISHANGNLGSDQNQNAGTGIYANVGSGCNKWLIKEYNPLPVTYTFKIENPTGEAVSATYNGNAITAEATVEIEGTVDTSLFGANDIEGYAWKVVVKRYARTITLVYEKKYTLSIADAPDGVAVTYNGNEVTTGSYLTEYDTQYLSVTCPNGYTWEVTRDDVNKTITITFTQLQAGENPASVVALIKRVGGESAAEKFKFVLDPSLNYTAEQFSIGGEDGKVLIKGTTLSAITAGIGWYLQNYAHINIAWNSLNEKTVSGAAYADLSSIPVPTSEDVHTSDAKYRYYLNYCTFGYSMTTWTWDRWQQEIDWMALHGVNMPLQIVGLEEVWRKFLTMENGDGAHKYNYTDEEAKAFVPGPAFTAWWGMNNLEGWGGTASTGWGGVQDDYWYERQKQLATQILTRQRELGMQPVLPGFSGMVPSDFEKKTGVTCDAGSWCGFTRPKIVLPSNARFAEIAADYYKCLEEVMGTSQYYSIDPFHEGGEITNGTTEQYNAAYKVIYEAMEQAKPGSQWVIQQWQWYNNTHQRLSVSALPEGRLIVLDLFSDGKPGFDSYGSDGGYAPQDAVFCAIPNFGGRSGLMGRLNSIVDNYFKFKGKYSTIKGVGAAPEAIEQTPVTYDLIFQLPWMSSKPDVGEWIENYSVARYGVEDGDFKEAWELLRQGPLNYGADAIEGPVEDVWAAIPNLLANNASAWGKTLNNSTAANTYTRERRQMLIDATYRLLSKNNKISGDVYLSNYYYDLVEFGGGVLADYAYDLLLGINTAKTAAGSEYATNETFVTRKNAFLALIEDVDAFKGTNLNFRLGKWTQEARAAATEAVKLGATTANADWYEYNNARTLITTWGDYGQSVAGGQALLRDYSYRSWQGLLKDFYLPRWQYYFENDCSVPSGNFFYFAWNWAHGMVYAPGDTQKGSTLLAENATGHTSSYTREPEGNTVDKATEVLGKYIIPIKADNGAYYAYRYLGTDINAFTAAVITLAQGSTVDLSSYLGDLTENGSKTVTVAGDAFNDASNFAATTIKSDATGNSTVTVTISDGTALTFTVNVVTAEFFTAKAALGALIEQMEALTNSVATYNPTGTVTEQPLSETKGTEGKYYIWCNAPQSGSSVGNLLDNTAGTFFHSNWESTTAPADGLDHHLTIELGEGNGIDDFKFHYQARSGSGLGDYPKTIKVQGSNNGTDYTDIKTVEPRNANGGTIENGAEWTSEVLGDGNTYTYLRFMVTATTTNKKKDGHIFWHMAEFDLYKVSSSADVYTYLEGGITDGQAAAAYDAMVRAIKVYDNGTTAEEMQTAKSELQTAYDELLEMFNTVLPFKPTIDEENPVLYKIFIKRTADVTVLQFDERSNKVAVVNKADDASYQAWYFVNSTNGFMIKPYNALGQVLSASSTTNNPGTVTVQDAGTETFYEWKLVARTDGYYNIQAHDGSNYFSNNGGTSQKMGFWSGDPASDTGSLFKFVEASFENDNPRYYQLKDYMEYVNIDGSNIYGGTGACLYTGGAEYREAYNVAAPLTTAGNTSDAAECYAAYKALRPAAEGLSYNAIDPNKVYYIISAATNSNTAYCQGKYVYSPNQSLTRTRGNYTGKHNHTHLIFDAYADIAPKAAAAFSFVETGTAGEYKMKSLNNDLYVKAFSGTHLGTEAEAATVKIAPYADGSVTLKIGNNSPMHAQNDYGVIVQWGVDAGNASLWTIEEADVEDFNYTLNVPESGVATLYLPYNVVLPTGVTAYSVKTDDILPDLDNNYYYDELVEVATAGEKLAKGTPVIIKAAEGEYILTATLDDTNAQSATSPALVGTYYAANINSDDTYKLYSVATEEGVPVFNAITAETEALPNSSWLLTSVECEKITAKVEPQDVEVVDGGVYRIHGRLSNGTLRTLYNNGSYNRIAWTTEEKDDVSTLFIAQAGANGKFKLVSALGNGIWNQDAQPAETGVELTFSAGSVNGATMIVGNNKRRFNVYGSGTSGNVDFYSNCTAEAGQYVTESQSTNFVLEPVDDATLAKYSLKMKKSYEWSTLYLPYAVKVPAGIEAYIATTGPSTVGGENVIELTKVENVVPANTAVILKRASTVAAETFNFVYAKDAEMPNVDGNIFAGRITEGYIGGDGMASKNFYILFRGDAGERLYWIYKEYDSNGNQVSHADNGYIKCSANKAYLALDAESSNAPSYSFRFSGTTGVDEITDNGVQSTGVYDLQGRKLTEITEPGVYIVNGKKVHVK